MLVSLGAVGCSGDTAQPDDAATTIGVGQEANSDLGAAMAEVPVLEGAGAQGDAVVDDNTIEQTYLVEGEDVESVFTGFYEPQLEELGWESTGELASVGSGYRELWERDGLTLTVVSEAGDMATQIYTDVIVTTAGT